MVLRPSSRNPIERISSCVESGGKVSDRSRPTIAVCGAKTRLNDGFTLIEVLVAIAITAMTVAAVSSSVLAAQRSSDAAGFYPRAMAEAHRIQAEQFGLLIERDSSLEISADDTRADWLIYRIEDRNRGITLACRK